MGAGPLPESGRSVEARHGGLRRLALRGPLFRAGVERRALGDAVQDPQCDGDGGEPRLYRLDHHRQRSDRRSRPVAGREGARRLQHQRVAAGDLCHRGRAGLGRHLHERRGRHTSSPRARRSSSWDSSWRASRSTPQVVLVDRQNRIVRHLVERPRTEAARVLLRRGPPGFRPRPTPCRAGARGPAGPSGRSRPASSPRSPAPAPARGLRRAGRHVGEDEGQIVIVEIAAALHVLEAEEGAGRHADPRLAGIAGGEDMVQPVGVVRRIAGEDVARRATVMKNSSTSPAWTSPKSNEVKLGCQRLAKMSFATTAPFTFRPSDSSNGERWSPCNSPSAGLHWWR